MKKTQYKQKKARALMKWFDDNIDCYKSFLVDEITDYEEVKDLTWFFPDDIRDWLRGAWYNTHFGEVEVKPYTIRRVKLHPVRKWTDEDAQAMVACDQVAS